MAPAGAGTAKRTTTASAVPAVALRDRRMTVLPIAGCRRARTVAPPERVRSPDGTQTWVHQGIGNDAEANGRSFPAGRTGRPGRPAAAPGTDRLTRPGRRPGRPGAGPRRP